VPAVNAPTKIPKADTDTISKFLYILFAPDFVHAFPDAWIEIVCIPPGGKLAWRFFSAHELKPIVDYVVTMNSRGYNVYVGAALRHGEKPAEGERAGKKHVCAASHFWADCDVQGCYERAVDICKREQLSPVMVHITGTTPNTRAQIWIKSAQPITSIAELEAATTALRDAFGSDKVQNADRIMRIAGTVNFPPPHKTDKGYIVELTTVQIARDAPTYSVEALCDLDPAKSTANDTHTSVPTGQTDHDGDPYQRFADERHREAGRLTDADMQVLLKKHTNGMGEGWHNDLRAVTWELLCRGYEPFAIQMVVGSACRKGFEDPDIGRLVYKKWDELQAERREAERDATSGKAQAASAGVALKLTYFGEFGEKAKKRPILKGFINKGESSSLIGPPKSLKSGLMAEIAIYCAAGQNWRGHSATESCGVVIFALERADLYRRRFDAYAQRDGYKDLPVAVAGAVIDLLNPNCVKTIVATVREVEQNLGRAVGLIVIDTFSKGIAAGGGDEDKAKDQNRVAANLRRVQGLIDVHIACVGHTGKDEGRGARGSNAHLGDIDLMIQISGDKIKTAKVTAANDQPERVLAQFQAELVDVGVDEDGEVETVAIVSNEEVSSADTGAASKLSDIQQAALDELFECIVDGETAPRPNDVHVPVGVRGLTLATWRNRLAARGVINPEGNPYQQFKRIYVRLAKLKKIGIWKEFVWPIN
jgi:AAA domain/RepB DNA-primase from phage plasmid